MRGESWRTYRSGLSALASAIAIGTALAACGGDESAKSATRLVPEGTKLSRLDISGTPSGRGGFRYRAPKTVAGGLVQIRFENAAAAPRKAQLWRVGGGHSVGQALHTGRVLPRWLTWAGGVGLTLPGATGTSVQKLSRGTYYVTGDRDQRRGVAVVQVRASHASATLPHASARITAVDYGYRVSGVKAGPVPVEFRNAGYEPHHAFFAPLRAGRTLAEARKFFAGKLPGPPPVDPENTRESVVLEGGTRQVTRLNLKSGRYALFCFVRDRIGGPPHYEKGMFAEVKVP